MAKRPSAGAVREAARRARARSVMSAPADRTENNDETIDQVFARLRSGAANVAGVSFQTSLAGYLLASGRSTSADLPRIVQVRPEGFEDIDCLLTDGSWLLVQSKQRGIGGRPIGLTELARIIAHAAQVMNASDYDGEVSGVAVVTNGTFSGDVGATGWGTTLADILDSDESKGLADALRACLGDYGSDPGRAESLLACTRTISMTTSVPRATESLLTEAYGLHPAVSSIVRTHLAADLGDLSGQQRGRTVAAASTRGVADMDSMVQGLVGDIDTHALDEAVRSGVCEFANFAQGSPVDEAEFFSGVRIVPGHIAANLDVVRIVETESVLEGLQHSNQVLIVGPSGTGKSGLLWRAASMLEDGPQVIRVLNLENESNARQLVHHVRQLRPNGDRRVLVCIDDLGRAATEYWPQARDRLLEIPGVKIIGACRQEDLLPSIAAGAVVLDSRLTADSASRIYDRMRQSAIPLLTEPEEAIARADGLLMEFVAIATTGRRLRDVLSTQIARLRAQDARLTLEALGVVVALHTLGFAVDANSLPRVLGTSSFDVSRALAELQNEHLATSDDGTSWRALHDLRAEVILEILHSTPPPTLAATYARSISAAPAMSRPVLYRRAAMRIGRRLGAEDPGDLALRLRRMHAAFRPLAGAMAADTAAVCQSNSRDLGSATLLGSLVEAAERLDVIAYATATLRFVERNTPPTMEVNSYYLMAYSSRFSDLFAGNEMFATLVGLGNQLPEWEMSAKLAVLAELSPPVVESVLMQTSLESAIEFSEALEDEIRISGSKASQIYQRHVASLAGDDSLRNAGLMAQLVATLSRLAGMGPEDIAQYFGSLQDRANWAVSADPFAFEVAVMFEDLENLPATSSSLARNHFFSSTRFAEIQARAFARVDGSPTAGHAYPPQMGGDPDSINSQAVFMAQRIFDACPEVDVVSVDIVFAHLSTVLNGVEGDGSKRLRAGVIPRRVKTRRAVAIQAAIIEIASSERWTARCRVQAQLAASLVLLLQEAPRRLGENDNARRRSIWVERVAVTASDVARMPGVPIDRSLFGIDDAQSPSAVELDQKLREGAKDEPRKALDLIAGSLYQVAQNLDDRSAIGGAGMRLAGAKQVLYDAREAALLPTFAGVGATLPTTLDELSVVVGRLFLAYGRGIIEPAALRVAETAGVAGLTSNIAERAAENSLKALRQLLRARRVEIVATASVEMDDPPDPLHFKKMVVGVRADDWGAAEQAIRSWTPGEREAAGFTSKCDLVVIVGSNVVRIGVSIWGTDGKILPILPSAYETIAEQLGMPLSAADFQEIADKAVESLVQSSYLRIRRAHRPAAWKPERSIESDDWKLALGVSGPPSWAQVLETLKSIADSEATGTASADTLAASIATVDIANPTSPLPPLVGLVTGIRLAAMEADLSGS